MKTKSKNTDAVCISTSRSWDEECHRRVVHGLDFTPEMVDEARSKNKMLLLDMDFTVDCNLKCFYCDRTPERLTEKEEKQYLTVEERKSLIRQAREMGAWAIGIVGAGEPMLDEGFWKLLSLMNELQIIPLVYTSGWEIKNIEVVKRLKKVNASVMLKYNSDDDTIADKMVGVKNYGVHVKQVLKWFLECGFNNSNPTKIGINVVATKTTWNEEAFLNLFRWSRENNIYMHGQSLIPEGHADNNKITMTRQEALELLEKTAEIDKKEYDYEYDIVPPIIGGYRCRKVNVGLFVNIFGEVWDCNGSGIKLGNVKDSSLKDIWNSEKSHRIRKPSQEGFCLIREHWWSKKA